MVANDHIITHSSVLTNPGLGQQQVKWRAPDVPLNSNMNILLTLRHCKKLTCKETSAGFIRVCFLSFNVKHDDSTLKLVVLSSLASCQGTTTCPYTPQASRNTGKSLGMHRHSCLYITTRRRPFPACVLTHAWCVV